MSVFDKLSDTKFLREVRSVAVVILVLSLGILYFGFWNDANLSLLVSFEIGGLALVSLISVRIWRFDVRTRAFEDECESNELIKAIEKEYEELSTKQVDIESCIDYVDKWNEREQKNANLKKTNKIIAKLKRKRDSKIIRYPRKVERIKQRYNTKIERLERTPKIDRRFKKVSVKQMLTDFKVKSSIEENGKQQFEYNPITHGSKTSLLKATLKFYGIGSGGSLIFNDLTNQAYSILIYYGLLILSMVLTLVFNYPVVRKNTRIEYLKKRRNKVKFIKNMFAHNKIERNDEE